MARSVTRRPHAGTADLRGEARDQLLAALERLIARGDSYTEISVERLAAEAGFSRSKFYGNFRDKGDFLRSCMADIRDEVRAATVDWFEGDRLTLEQLGETARTIFDVFAPRAALLAAIYETAAYDEATREAMSHLVVPNMDALAEHIERGQAGGWIAGNVDPVHTSRWLLWMAQRGQEKVLLTVDEAEREQAIDTFVALVWNVLYRHAPTAP